MSERVCFRILCGWLFVLILLGASPIPAAAPGDGLSLAAGHDTLDRRDARLGADRHGPRIAASHPDIDDTDPPTLAARLHRAAPAAGPRRVAVALVRTAGAHRLPAAPPTGPPAS